MKDVIISINGMIGADLTDETDMIFETDGKYSYENGRARFNYMESELTGMKGTFTEFSIDPDGVMMSRTGTVSTCMRFRKGEKQYSFYNTLFGCTTLGIDTHRVTADMKENGGHLELNYDVDVEGTVVTRNHVSINIRETRSNSI